jgi:hypothetical protein
MLRIFFGIILIVTVSVLLNCGGTGNSTNTTGAAGEDTPTGAYKRLYAAVKAKDTETIKALMTKKSLEFAKMLSAQQNKPIEQVLENGYTATTFAPSLPQIRDERVNGDMGAVEVHNDRENKWEDLPFIREDGQWKLAIGEMFANTWKSPGKSQSLIEREAANAATNSVVPANNNVNGNFTAGRPANAKLPTNNK